MSSRQLLACKYCKRNNFKTQSGLQLHLRFSRSCNEEARIQLEDLAEVAGASSPGMTSNLEDAPMEDGSENGSDSGGMYLQGDDEYDYTMPKVIEEQDDDDWGVGDNPEPEDMDNDDPARERLIDFRRYVREVRDEMQPFTKKEEAAIELLRGLLKKHASMDTYDYVMQWHVSQTAHLRDLGQYDVREGQDGFISRQVLMT